MKYIRTSSDNQDFKELVKKLDTYLAVTDGDEHAFYDQYNSIDDIKHCLVAYDGDKAVACGAIKAFDSESQEVKRMFTLTEYRGRGLASSLLAELEKWALELGSKSTILETGLRQVEAVALYKKCGYSIIPNYGQYADMENSVCFKKELFL